MSLPVEIRDELLTGYLDGQLTRDERRRVERLLETDSEAREVLERLSANREVLQQLASQFPGLDDRFAERVWAATAAAARDENVDAAHPVRLAQSGGDGYRRQLQRRWRRAGAAMAVLAASLLIGLSLYQSAVLNDGEGIAQHDEPENPPVLVENGEAEVGASAEEQLDPSGITDSRLADNSAETRTEDDAADVDVVPESRASDSMLADSDRGASGADREQDPGQNGGAYDALVELLPGAAPQSTAGTPEAAPAGAAPSMILVYEVVLTERGVERGILEHAMSEAGIELGERAAVLDPQEVESLAAVQLAAPNSPSADADEGVQVWYIEAPMQRIEYLSFVLAAAAEDVERVGLKLVADPPVVSTVRQASELDPASIRQPGGANVAIQLALESAGRQADEFVVEGDLGTSNLLARTLPTKEEFEKALRDAPTVISPMLLVVHQP